LNDTLMMIRLQPHKKEIPMYLKYTVSSISLHIKPDHPRVINTVVTSRWCVRVWFIGDFLGQTVDAKPLDK